jgi:hypothetical protein
MTTTDLVAIVLSGGMVFALNLFILASILEAYSNPVTLPVGLSDNATQVLASWGGGIIGVIGALVGVGVGRRRPQVSDAPTLPE